MWFQDLAPIHILIPRGRCKGFVGRDFKHVGITEAATAHTRAMQNHHALEDADLQDPIRADGWHPNISPILPVAFCEVSVIKAPAFFKD